MRRRSRASNKLPKARSRKAKTLKAARRSSSVAGQETEVARFRRERDQALEREIATAEVLKVISSSPGDVKSVFEAILENATRICEAKFGILLTYQNELFHPIAHRNTPPGLLEFLNQRGPFQPPRGTSLDQLLKTNDFVHRADDSVDQAPSSPARLGGAKSHLAVPMFKNKALVGAITIWRQEVRPFTDKQIALVTNFAAQAVIAIENAGLLNELRESLQQQTATADVLKVISSSPGELETIFSTVLENAVRICEASFGNMYLHDGDVFRLAAAHNTPPALAEERKRAPLRGRTSNLGRMVQTKQVVHVVDLSAEQSYLDRDPEAVSGVELGHIRTIVFVPMLKDTDLIGAIVIYRQEVRPFTDKQIELVSNFARQAVIAIENTRLLNELRESLEQQTATSEVLEVISSSPGELEPTFHAMLESAARIC